MKPQVIALDGLQDLTVVCYPGPSIKGICQPPPTWERVLDAFVLCSPLSNCMAGWIGVGACWNFEDSVRRYNGLCTAFGNGSLKTFGIPCFLAFSPKRPCVVDVLAALGPGGESSFVRASLKALIISAHSVSFFLAEGPNSSP